jgi:hypothetical protein
MKKEIGDMQVVEEGISKSTMSSSHQSKYRNQIGVGKSESDFLAREKSLRALRDGRA